VTELQLYYGDDFYVNDKIIIHQPTIGEILEFDKKYGESSFWSMLNIFTGNPTSYRLFLWKDMNIDWNYLDDYHLFLILHKTLTTEQTSLIFKDLDFQKFQLFTAPQEEWEIDENEPKDMTDIIRVLYHTTLYDPENDIELDEDTYNIIVYYLRSAFNMFPKIEKAKDRTTKEWMIEEEEIKLNTKSKEKQSSTSYLLPLISGCVNHPGFKYNKRQLKNVGYYEFMDSVQRLQILESTTALLHGSYSGFMDSSKIDKEQFNFMREIVHEYDKGIPKKKKLNEKTVLT
jgi:hypothetical protein